VQIFLIVQIFLGIAKYIFCTDALTEVLLIPLMSYAATVSDNIDKVNNKFDKN
jgi:hypothetical protein